MWFKKKEVWDDERGSEPDPKCELPSVWAEYDRTSVIVRPMSIEPGSADFSGSKLDLFFLDD